MKIRKKAYLVCLKNKTLIIYLYNIYKFYFFQIKILMDNIYI